MDGEDFGGQGFFYLGMEKVKLQVLLLVGTWPMLLLLQSAL